MWGIGSRVLLRWKFRRGNDGCGILLGGEELERSYVVIVKLFLVVNGRNLT